MFGSCFRPAVLDDHVSTWGVYKSTLDKYLGRLSLNKPSARAYKAPNLEFDPKRVVQRMDSAFLWNQCELTRFDKNGWVESAELAQHQFGITGDDLHDQAAIGNDQITVGAGELVTTVKPRELRSYPLADFGSSASLAPLDSPLVPLSPDKMPALVDVMKHDTEGLQLLAVSMSAIAKRFHPSLTKNAFQLIFADYRKKRMERIFDELHKDPQAKLFAIDNPKGDTCGFVALVQDGAHDAAREGEPPKSHIAVYVVPESRKTGLAKQTLLQTLQREHTQGELLATAPPQSCGFLKNVGFTSFDSDATRYRLSVA